MQNNQRCEEVYIYREKPAELQLKLHQRQSTITPLDYLIHHELAPFLTFKKAIKPINQLRMVEDATVIYRLSRAERRIFYVDVGSLPKNSRQYVHGLMNRYVTNLYTMPTQEIRDDRKFMNMLEDYWFPRREGGKGTSLYARRGQNLGEMKMFYILKRNFGTFEHSSLVLKPTMVSIWAERLRSAVMS